ncbi:MAG: lycopene cyclase domain-containing protein [Chloroflexota bacterium]|nr:lycopene cyclase domain-containing protein [Chloroflexota bacterium]
MKYFGFLAKFVIIPLTIFTFLNWRHSKNAREQGESPLPRALNGMPPAVTLLGHVAVAVAYTTPWDNYLVASRVWWYDPKLVTGIILGYVPLEEYTFFVLQTLLTGSWMLFLAQNLPANEQPPAHPLAIRVGMTAAIGLIWAASVWNLLWGPKARTYLSLTLSWALLPIMFQAAFGGDILWQHRRLIALGIIPATLYLGLSDSLAIDSGTWTINPEKTVNVHIGGKLPLEEGLFFLLTNTLIALGFTLVQSPESRKRVPKLMQTWIENHLLKNGNFN